MRKFFNNIKNKWNEFCCNPDSIKTATYLWCFIWVVFLLWLTQQKIIF